MKLKKKIEMLITDLKRILCLWFLQLLGPWGARHEFLLAATAKKPQESGQDVSRTAASAKNLIRKA